LTQGYQLPLKAFQLFGISRLYRMPYGWGILKFGNILLLLLLLLLLLELLLL